jgi:twinkle protein
MTIRPDFLQWFEANRKISAETVLRMGLYSGRVQRTGEGDDAVSEVVPDDQGGILVFPFLENGSEVNAKYRGPQKRFWQKREGRKTFFNADVLDDPAVSDGGQALAITEGEIDTMTFVDCGYPFSVSVPDGAPPGRDKEGKIIVVPESAEGIDPETDDKFRFIVNNWDRLAKVKKIIIATDDDEPGRRLAAELVRRLGRVRCWFVLWPQEKVVPTADGSLRSCKDANEVRCYFGAAAVIDLITRAKPYPVSGVYRLSDFPPEVDLQTVTTGWAHGDTLLRLYHPALMVVTGFAGAGKSTWANQLVAQAALIHEWNAAIASFEMRVRPYVTRTLMSVYDDQAKPSLLRAQTSQEWVEDRFTFIAPEPDDEATHDIAWLIERMEVAVIRHGARVILVDPWNEIEHVRQPGESETDYTGRAIMLLKRFCRRMDVLLIIVAHPQKSAIDKGPDKVSLYDISGSAHFANKADLGVVVARKATGSGTTVLVKKIRYQPDAGTIGSFDLDFDRKMLIFREAETAEDGEELPF